MARACTSAVASRTIRTGWAVWDKYLGDALYAAMVYAILRLTGRVRRVVVWASVVMAGLELFQATGVPSALLASGDPVLKVAARLIGTRFSVWDLAAYAVGIAVTTMAEGRPESRPA